MNPSKRSQAATQGVATRETASARATILSVRLAPDLKRALERAAAAQHRTLSSYVQHTLASTLPTLEKARMNASYGK